MPQQTLTHTILTHNARHALIPCGHDEDALGLEATGGFLVYCGRCERGYQAPPVPA